MIDTELAGVSDRDVNELLCQFITEVRKDGGERYPAKTLHELVSSLQKHFEMKGRKVSFFSDEIFEKYVEKISGYRNENFSTEKAGITA